MRPSRLLLDVRCPKSAILSTISSNLFSESINEKPSPSSGLFLLIETGF